MTSINTMVEQRQGWAPLLREGIGIFFINFLNFIILDDILNFSRQLNKSITEKVLWPKLYERMIRYKPFLKYNTTKYKQILKKKIKEI